jgi:hypothetical protein
MPNYLGDTINSQERQIETLRKFYESGPGLFHRHGYWINGVYHPNQSADELSHEWQKRIKPLRNVVPRAVDFFSLKMLPGDVSIITDDDQLKEAVEQILKWSNFDEKKKLYLTDLALTGELFLRVGIMADKVYFQYIPPEDVTAIDEDWRGYLQNIRIDYMVPGDNGVLLNHTEFWNKEYFAIWEGNLSRGTPVEELGTPIIYEMLSSYGLDFCPVVHIKFKDIGRVDFRGVGCVTQSLPVIEEACREATDLCKNAFRDRQTWVLSAASIDANNFTLDPIKVIKQVSVIDAIPGESQQNVTPDDIWQAPAMSTITSLLAGINWEGLSAIIDQTMEELNQEIPALRYWSMKDQANIAAKTVSLLLDAALSQARESARSFVSGLVRACQIALTMGIYQGLFQASLGNYAAGDFDFDVTAGQAFEPSIDDMATTMKSLKDAGIPLEASMHLAGFTDDQIDEATAQSEAEQAAKVEQLKQALTGINEANAKPTEPDKLRIQVGRKA